MAAEPPDDSQPPRAPLYSISAWLTSLPWFVIALVIGLLILVTLVEIAE